ncbi:AAA family ATPase [Rhodococcus sp. 06-235-1A]|uniref:ATP-binding protein n=1 Tax=Rhodococcus sp. 06-235-1A TaxID=2022508 RepID=UPI000B9ADB93|nr:ATP-binding protein [Rhodococcus sp. 06-235-1A]OZC99397.1 AAA family ATPase [Rhodococcus sp. 06-235-1A]
MTDNEQIRALESVRLSWAPTPDDVWRSQSNVHVPGMHERVFLEVMNAYDDADASDDASPLGVVVRGPAGSGKTHLLGQVREEVQLKGGYFFLIRLLDAAGFWRSTLMGMLDDLMRPSGRGSDSQLGLLLRRLCEIGDISDEQRAKIMGEHMIDAETLDAFVTAVYKVHPRHRRTSQHTLRALVLSIAPDSAVQDLGDAYLQSIDDVDPEEFSAWGIRRAELGHQGIAENISRLLAITGPTILAIDQIDTLVAQSRTGSDQEFADAQEDKVVEQLAHGLMSLRETLPRTASVLSALSSAWELIAARGVAPMRDRFRVTQSLKPIPSSDVGRLLLGRRLAACFLDAGFTPPHPTWPVAPDAFEQAPDFTPRQLLIAVDRHIRHCLDTGVASELTSFTDRSGPTDAPDLPKARVDELDILDDRYRQLRDQVDVSVPLRPDSEDSIVPALLSAGLTAWIHEHQSSDDSLAQDPPPSGKPALHARLRHTVDTDTDDEEHWCFRAVTSGNARAALARVERAVTTAGLRVDMPKRRLILVRNDPWPNGAKTEQTIAALRRAGGVVVPLSDEDRRALAALSILLSENSPALTSWLLARKPAHDVELFGAVLPAVSVVDDDTALIEPETPITAEAPPASRRPSIVVGAELSTGADVAVPLEALRKHTAIFAGSGSGKTVLIRRLVEECALQGVSAIVLDVNNDLARLGTAWPEDERTWPPGDEAKATAYLRDTDVVVWTPRKSAGRPLSFQPLPDFVSVLGDADEFDASVESALASLEPAAGVLGTSQKAKHGRAVLKSALDLFGRRPHGGNLTDFIDLLEEFPEDASEMRDAVRIAAGLAENLKAAAANDPMFAGAGTPVDPAVLLTPAVGKKARVSVINLAGLTTDEQKQSFVNQLQMGLFAWIKKNPAGDRPLGGLFVMDEAQNFAPSDRTTAATHSTLALASQARKYGLGLVFATQAPKGLHNRIAGNASTQFYGLLNSPSQVDAAKEMARVKGGSVPDVGRLPAGQFYAAVEGSEFRRTATPLCLSYHPKSPPTEEEVIELARS